MPFEIFIELNAHMLLFIIVSHEYDIDGKKSNANYL